MPKEQVDDSRKSTCLTRAGLIAFVRKLKRLRKNSPRAMAQWWNTRRENEISSIFIEAMNFTRQTLHDPDYQVIDEHLLMLLRTELVNKKRGRKSEKLTGTGLLFAKSSHRGGRPPAISLDEERRWMERAMGVKLGLWATQVKKVYTNPGFDNFLNDCLGRGMGMKELGEGITDRSVLTHKAMQGFNPPAKTVESLMRRLSTARKTYSFTWKSVG